MFVIAFKSGESTKGPFLTERAMLFCLPLHDKLVGTLVITRFVTQRRLTPGSHRVIALDPTFATSVRMVDRIHHHTANRRPHTHMTDTSGLTQSDVLVVEIADLADRCHAIHVDEPDFA